jgi:hypothetical protein
MTNINSKQLAIDDIDVNSSYTYTDKTIKLSALRKS